MGQFCPQGIQLVGKFHSYTIPINLWESAVYSQGGSPLAVPGTGPWWEVILAGSVNTIGGSVARVLMLRACATPVRALWTSATRGYVALVTEQFRGGGDFLGVEGNCSIVRAVG